MNHGFGNYYPRFNCELTDEGSLFLQDEEPGAVVLTPHRAWCLYVRCSAESSLPLLKALFEQCALCWKEAIP